MKEEAVSIAAKTSDIDSQNTDTPTEHAPKDPKNANSFGAGNLGYWKC